MRQYQLADIYTSLRQAVSAGREAEAVRALGLVLGAELPVRPAQATLPVTLAPMLTYRGFKPAELAMLAAGRKPVVKLEDLPLALARAFTERHAGHYRIVESAPYRKDYLLLRSRPAPLAAADALVSLYVSRGDEAERLFRLEQEHREDIAGCGALLGFPTCCVAAFVADFAQSRADQDTVNDDACRRVLTTGEPHAELNPLSDLELLGFYPCRLDCPAALALARGNLTALLTERPDLRPRLRQALAAPVLYWRLPFFATLAGEWQDDALMLTGVQVNAFPDVRVRRIQALFATQLAGMLAGADRLRPVPQGLAVQAGSQMLRLLPGAPVLVRWRLDPSVSIF